MSAAIEADRKIIIDQQIEGGPFGVIGDNPMTQQFKEQTERIERIKTDAFFQLFVSSAAIIIGSVFSIVALNVSASAILSIAFLVSLVAAYTIARAYFKNSADIKRTFNRLFKEILESEAGKLTPDKIKLFQIHGHHCTRLNLSQYETGIELCQFLRLKQATLQCDLFKPMLIKAYLNDTARTFVSYSHPSLRKLTQTIREQEEILSADSPNEGMAGQGAKMDKAMAAVNEAITELLSIENYAIPLHTPHLVKSSEIVSLIDSCSNLEYLHLGYCLDPEVREASKRIKKCEDFESLLDAPHPGLLDLNVNVPLGKAAVKGVSGSNENPRPDHKIDA